MEVQLELERIQELLIQKESFRSINQNNAQY